MVFQNLLLAAQATPVPPGGSGDSGGYDIGGALMDGAAQADSTFSMMGVSLFEDEIDQVLFETNSFLTDGTFVGAQGPFWYILQASMCLAALFAILMGAGMAYKMMVKGEPFDPMKILKVLGIAVVMMFWYGGSGGGGFFGDDNENDGGVLDALAYIPNCIGSWTYDLYYMEATNVQGKVTDVSKKLKKLQAVSEKQKGESDAMYKIITDKFGREVASAPPENEAEEAKKDGANNAARNTAGTLILIDKLLFYLGMILYRVGVWGTIYAQQILLGVLTIFGPFYWAFSILPKWEGAWAKWVTRYLTVHLYGAMIYFVGFYVMLLFDVVLSIQADQLGVILEEANDYENLKRYIGQVFLTSGYFLVTATVAVKCLAMIPDLASWILPEGETAMSVRGFGEGVSGAIGGRVGIR